LPSAAVGGFLAAFNRHLGGVVSEESVKDPIVIPDKVQNNTQKEKSCVVVSAISQQPLPLINNIKAVPLKKREVVPLKKREVVPLKNVVVAPQYVNRKERDALALDGQRFMSTYFNTKTDAEIVGLMRNVEQKSIPLAHIISTWHERHDSLEQYIQNEHFVYTKEATRQIVIQPKDLSESQIDQIWPIIACLVNAVFGQNVHDDREKTIFFDEQTKSVIDHWQALGSFQNRIADGLSCLDVVNAIDGLKQGSDKVKNGAFVEICVGPCWVTDPKKQACVAARLLFFHDLILCEASRTFRTYQ